MTYITPQPMLYIMIANIEGLCGWCEHARYGAGLGDKWGCGAGKRKWFTCLSGVADYPNSISGDMENED